MLLFLYPLHLVFASLLDTLEPGGTGRVPGVVGSATIGAPMYYGLLRLVFGQASLCWVAAAADPAHVGTGAVGLVVAKTLTTITAEGLGGVRAGVVHPPVPQVEVGREGAPDTYEHLASFCLVP